MYLGPWHLNIKWFIGWGDIKIEVSCPGDPVRHLPTFCRGSFSPFPLIPEVDKRPISGKGKQFGSVSVGLEVGRRGWFFPSGVSSDDIDQLGSCCLLSLSSPLPTFLESLWNYCQCPTPGEHLFWSEPPGLCHHTSHPRDQMDRQGDVHLQRWKGGRGERGSWVPTSQMADTVAGTG